MELSMIQPQGDRVLVKTIIETESPGGVIIPEISQGRPERATVLAVGPGSRAKDGQLIPVDVEVGDEVYFNRMAGTHVGDDRHILFREQDLFAVVTASD